MHYESRDDSITFGGKLEYLTTTTGWWCDNCGEAIFDGTELACREHAFLDLKKDGV